MARKKKGIDYRDFGPNGPPQQESAATGYWWAAEEKNRHEAVWAALKTLESQHTSRMLASTKWMRLYSDKDAFAFSPHYYDRLLVESPPRGPIGRERITFNVVRMAIDTLEAKIAKSRPKATFVTDGGDWSMQQRAKGLDKFVQGVSYQNNVPAKARKAFKDACTLDIGALKFYRDWSDPKRICIDRVLPTELFVDDLDGLYGSPRQMHQVAVLPREVLVQMYPDFAKEIREAEEPHIPTPYQKQQTLSDFVLVAESWHLPSGPEAGDGRHCITISDATLVDEEWKRDRFPFAFFRFGDRPVGFFGQGVAEQLEGVQLSINKKLKTINACLHLLAVPRVLVEETSGVVGAQINNELGAIVKYRGVEPKFVAANAVPPELWDALERDKARAFELIGLSQLSVAAKKPAGLNSGAALREYNDNESERFVTVGQAWEEFHLEIARQILDLAKEIAAEDGDDFNVTIETKGSLETVSWKDVHLDEDAFILKAFPTSSLPTTPAARQQTVSEWVQNGWVDANEARRLLDFPDLEASNNVAFAAAEDIERQVADVLEKGDYQPPEPFQDLAFGVRRFQSAYLRAKRMGVPEERLEMLRNWMDAANDMLQQAQAASQPPTPPPGAAPAGPAGPPAPSPMSPPAAA